MRHKQNWSGLVLMDQDWIKEAIEMLDLAQSVIDDKRASDRVYETCEALRNRLRNPKHKELILHLQKWYALLSPEYRQADLDKYFASVGHQGSWRECMGELTEIMRANPSLPIQPTDDERERLNQSIAQARRWHDDGETSDEEHASLISRYTKQLAKLNNSNQ